jgi:hypothetical protein
MQKPRRALLVLTPPFHRGKSKLPVKLGERCGVASGKHNKLTDYSTHGPNFRGGSVLNNHIRSRASVG